MTTRRSRRSAAQWSEPGRTVLFLAAVHLRRPVIRLVRPAGPWPGPGTGWPAVSSRRPSAESGTATDRERSGRRRRAWSRKLPCRNLLRWSTSAAVRAAAKPPAHRPTMNAVPWRQVTHRRAARSGHGAGRRAGDPASSIRVVGAGHGDRQDATASKRRTVGGNGGSGSPVRRAPPSADVCRSRTVPRTRRGIRAGIRPLSATKSGNCTRSVPVPSIGRRTLPRAYGTPRKSEP